jgi:hypothetical protein
MLGSCNDGLEYFDQNSFLNSKATGTECFYITNAKAGLTSSFTIVYV